MRQFTQRSTGASWDEQSASLDRARHVPDSVAPETARHEFGCQDFEALADPLCPTSAPLFRDPLYVGRPNLGDRERLLARITDILDRRWFTNNGEYVQEFEKRIADFLEVEHCIAMSNGTVALEIAIRAAGLTGEVLVPSFTFIATAHALQWQQITPSFCDVDLDTHTLDATRLERMITPRTTGIVAVHLWGRPCDVDALSDVARRHNLVLLFDAAHALGCSYKGRMIGGFGDAEILSFHATKFFNTFEGGAVVTNNGDLAAKMRLMRNFGFSGYDTVIHVGTNGKMTEIAAAMGLTSLESYEEFVAVNYRNYEHYQNGLDGIPGVSLVRYDETERCNYQYIVVRLDETAAGISRDALVSLLNSHNVIARRYFYPGCHRMEPYRSLFPHAGLGLPQTDRLCREVITLPTGQAVSERDIQLICQLVRVAVTSRAGRPLGLP